MDLNQSFGVIHLKTVDSTNSWAKKAFAQNKISSGAVIVADTQSDGRGQVQTKWHDEPAKNLLTTIFLDVNKLQASSFFKLNEAISLAIIDALEPYTSAKIKWPNDILVDGKKIAGILIETSIKGTNIAHAFVGIGCNLNQREFHESLDATSLSLLTNRVVDRDVFLKGLLESVRFRIAQIQNRVLLERNYLENLWGVKEYLPYRDSNEEFFAIIHSIETDGRLVLKVKGEDDLRYYRFKEVELLKGS